MRKDFLVFGKPQITAKDIERAVATLESGWLGAGPQVKQFEAMFAVYKGVDSSQVIAVNSCTSGLSLSLTAAGLKQGDEVITTAMTFCATVNAILHAGCTPVVVDVDKHSKNIDVSKIEASITPKTKALMVVHFAGYPCAMDAIMAIAKKHNLIVIEDGAHAIETKYNGKHIGTIGDFGCFSFYATKNLTTGGDGGAIICKDKDTADFVRRLALHGMSKDAWKRFSHKGFAHYDVVDPGFKCNMTDLSACIGIGGLERIDENLNTRRKIFAAYHEAFKDLPLELPVFDDPNADIQHAYHLYSVGVKADAGMTRDELAQKLNERNIGVGIHYRAVTAFSYYQQSLGWNEKTTPVATAIGEHTLSFPLSASMNDTDVNDVIEAVRDVFGQ